MANPEASAPSSESITRLLPAKKMFVWVWSKCDQWYGLLLCARWNFSFSGIMNVGSHMPCVQEPDQTGFLGSCSLSGENPNIVTYQSCSRVTPLIPIRLLAMYVEFEARRL